LKIYFEVKRLVAVRRGNNVYMCARNM